jgi:hypothetical protein
MTSILQQSISRIVLVAREYYRQYIARYNCFIVKVEDIDRITASMFVSKLLINRIRYEAATDGSYGAGEVFTQDCDAWEKATGIIDADITGNCGEVLDLDLCNVNMSLPCCDCACADQYVSAPTMKPNFSVQVDNSLEDYPEVSVISPSGTFKMRAYRQGTQVFYAELSSGSGNPTQATRWSLISGSRTELDSLLMAYFNGTSFAEGIMFESTTIPAVAQGDVYVVEFEDRTETFTL